MDCDQLRALLDSLVQHAAQRYPVSRSHRFEVCRAGGQYRIRENGQEGDPHADARSAVETVFWRMHLLALEALPEFTKIHAGCASWGGRRFLAIGPAQSGKTTLMTRLLYEGFAVHGDDMALLRGGEVLAYPRRFGIRPPTVALIPQLARLASPADGSHGTVGLALDPSELGFDWRIEPAPVDAVFFLEPNHGGSTELQAFPKYLMAERIMSQSTPPAAGPRDWISDICAMIRRADCYLLHFGDLGVAVSMVKAALHGTLAAFNLTGHAEGHHGAGQA